MIAEESSIGLCAGYEGNKWRAKKLAGHIFSWLPQVALDQTRKDTLDAANWHERVELAAAHVYRTKKTESRGEIGEILLHIACVQEFGTLPVLCKLILKTSHNDTVKGFDAVHVVYNKGDIELWLGESKFYTDPRRAIRDALASVREHLLPAFLDTEKAMLYGHIPEGIPQADGLQKLLHQNTTSDKLLKQSVFPVLIAYESTAISKHSDLTDEFQKEIEGEISALHQLVADSKSDIKVRLQLIFVPMHLKADLVEFFDKKLEAFA
ncbi:DUF1837 domain-containing protein [Sulfitobacter sp. PS-8MA]|uniref:DUF1837 domain-containing protein n=1 Tax=Sulfitobacter sp. PS-8MA TaxID=3237707 RepID=UPI0034C63F13